MIRMKKYEILIALGSNLHQKENMAKARRLLSEHFPDVTFSRELWTEPIGLASDKFLNLLAWAHTSMPADGVLALLKDIEAQCGASKADKRVGRVEADLDLLSYGGTRYHVQDWQRGYVQELLRDVGNIEKLKN